MPREWDSPIRNPWNPKIKSILDTIDIHTQMHLESGDNFHWLQAEILRKYILELKSWIHSQEN
jgi:hypothetical protein